MDPLAWFNKAVQLHAESEPAEDVQRYRAIVKEGANKGVRSLTGSAYRRPRLKTWTGFTDLHLTRVNLSVR